MKSILEAIALGTVSGIFGAALISWALRQFQPSRRDNPFRNRLKTLKLDPKSEAAIAVTLEEAYTMLYERLKKLSFLLTGNDHQFFGENPEIEKAVRNVWSLELSADRLRLLEILWSKMSDQEKYDFMLKELSGPFKVKLSGVDVATGDEIRISLEKLRERSKENS